MKSRIKKYLGVDHTIHFGCHLVLSCSRPFILHCHHPYWMSWSDTVVRLEPTPSIILCGCCVSRVVVCLWTYIRHHLFGCRVGCAVNHLSLHLNHHIIHFLTLIHLFVHYRVVPVKYWLSWWDNFLFEWWQFHYCGPYVLCKGQAVVELTSGQYQISQEWHSHLPDNHVVFSSHFLFYYCHWFISACILVPYSNLFQIIRRGTYPYQILIVLGMLPTFYEMLIGLHRPTQLWILWTDPQALDQGSEGWMFGDYLQIPDVHVLG